MVHPGDTEAVEVLEVSKNGVKRKEAEAEDENGKKAKKLTTKGVCPDPHLVNPNTSWRS